MRSLLGTRECSPANSSSHRFESPRDGLELRGGGPVESVDQRSNDLAGVKNQFPGKAPPMIESFQKQRIVAWLGGLETNRSHAVPLA
ncbi:hypothetical protein [Flaviflexus massiliensis]|uniref:hypothetical protein n=1 Tax=Flaviflexus massiliensis TaxID=1522309 RepID=UPI0006D54C03|nr:hypothetical protein [Flaviflexus massiliensis]